MGTMARKLSGALALLLMLLPVGCHRMTEEEALEAARDEVRKEMRPEIERRQKEIVDLERQIAEAKARIAAGKARQRSP
jgi:hypothetical protein